MDYKDTNTDKAAIGFSSWCLIVFNNQHKILHRQRMEEYIRFIYMMTKKHVSGKVKCAEKNQKVYQCAQM